MNNSCPHGSAQLSLCEATGEDVQKGKSDGKRATKYWMRLWTARRLYGQKK